MKYTKKQRLSIGRQIYENELSRCKAAEVYGISEGSAREYMRLYRDENALPPKSAPVRSIKPPSLLVPPVAAEDIQSMSREELIGEIIKARIEEARLKRGYELRQDGSVVFYGSVDPD